MVKTDKVILQLKKEIELQKTAITKAAKFNPVTNLTLKLYGELFNLNVSSIDDLFHLQATLNVLLQNGNDYKISGYKLSEWLEDISSKITIKRINEEKAVLVSREKRLESLLSTEAKVNLELESIMKEMKNN